MKKWLIGLLLLTAIISIALHESGSQLYRTGVTTVSVSTSAATVAGGINTARRWWVGANESLTYGVRVATWNVTGADMQSRHPNLGWYIAPDYGSVDDKILCSRTSYYVIIDSVSCPVAATALSANFTYMERD